MQTRSRKSSAGKKEIRSPQRIRSVRVVIPEDSDLSCDLCVRNVPSNTTEKDIKDVFESYGQIHKIRLMKDNSGDVKCSFISFKKPETVRIAVTEFLKSDFRRDGVAWSVGRVSKKVAKQALAANTANVKLHQSSSLGQCTLYASDYNPPSLKKKENKIKIDKKLKSSNANLRRSDRPPCCISTIDEAEYKPPISKKEQKMVKLDDINALSFRAKDVGYLTSQISALMDQKATLQEEVQEAESKVGVLEIAEKKISVMCIVLSYLSRLD